MTADEWYSHRYNEWSTGMTTECPDCYGAGVLAGEICPLCNGATTAEYRANRARQNAAVSYRQRAAEFVKRGQIMHEADADAAVGLWLDGMKALDAALEVEKGLESDPWRGTSFGSGD